MTKEQEHFADQIFASAERHGDLEGTETQLGDMDEALKLLLALLTPAQIAEVRPAIESIFDRVYIGFGTDEEIEELNGKNSGDCRDTEDQDG